MTYQQARKARPAFLAELALIDAEYGTEIPGRKAGRKTPEEHYTFLGRETIAAETKRPQYLAAIRSLVDRYLAA